MVSFPTNPNIVPLGKQTKQNKVEMAKEFFDPGPARFTTKNGTAVLKMTGDFKPVKGKSGKEADVLIEHKNGKKAWLSAGGPDKLAEFTGEINGKKIIGFISEDGFIYQKTGGNASNGDVRIQKEGAIGNEFTALSYRGRLPEGEVGEAKTAYNKAKAEIGSAKTNEEKEPEIGDKAPEVAEEKKPETKVTKDKGSTIDWNKREEEMKDLGIL